jgi:hypothetical protein
MAFHKMGRLPPLYQEKRKEKSHRNNSSGVDRMRVNTSNGFNFLNEVKI